MTLTTLDLQYVRTLYSHHLGMADFEIARIAEISVGYATALRSALENQGDVVASGEEIRRSFDGTWHPTFIRVG